MSFKRQVIIFLIICFACSLATEAQRRRPLRLWEGFRVIPKAGVNMFYGDLVDESRTNYSLGVSVDREFKPHWTGRFQIMAGSMKGTQLAYGNNEVSAYFDNFYTDITFGATFRPLELAFGYFKQRSVNPYVFAQTGVVLFNASEYYGPASGYEPDLLWRETGMKVAPVISGGLGVSIRLNSYMSVVGEFTGYKPFSDLLDGHEEWTAGDGRIVETDDSDFYYTATVGISYLIKDNRWRNNPKYNRKAYQKTRKAYSSGAKKKSAKRYKSRR